MNHFFVKGTCRLSKHSQLQKFVVRECYEGSRKWEELLGAMRFPDSGKFQDLFHSPKIEILRIGNLGKESGEGVGGSGNLMAPITVGRVRQIEEERV
jgi:hypothetical protein